VPRRGIGHEKIVRARLFVLGVDRNEGSVRGQRLIPESRAGRIDWTDLAAVSVDPAHVSIRDAGGATRLVGEQAPSSRGEARVTARAGCPSQRRSHEDLVALELNRPRIELAGDERTLARVQNEPRRSVDGVEGPRHQETGRIPVEGADEHPFVVRLVRLGEK
jgi:hypothetical protein